MTKTVVIFNAPPNSGKDVATEMLWKYFQSGTKLAFKDSLYSDVASHYNISVTDLIEYHEDRKRKESPSEMFPKYDKHSLKQYFFALLFVIGAVFNNRYLMSLGYYSSREALIHVSEDIMKPKYGSCYYGESLARKVEQSDSRFFFVSDSGYKDEAIPLLDNGYNVHIVKLERSGATFERDSRTLLNEDDFKAYSNIKFTTIINNGSLDELYENIREFAFDLVLNTTKDVYPLQNKYGGNMEDIQSEYEIVET